MLVQVTFSSSILFRTELEEPHNYDTTISYLSQSSNSINLCAAGETTDSKSAKPINIITLRGVKMCRDGLFPVANDMLRCSHPFCSATVLPLSLSHIRLLAIYFSPAGHQHWSRLPINDSYSGPLPFCHFFSSPVILTALPFVGVKKKKPRHCDPIFLTSLKEVSPR